VRPLVLAAAALAVVLSAAPASAQETKTTTVPAELVFHHGNRPGDAGNCSAVVFGKWKDVPNTVSATINYTWRGEPYTKSGTPPWDDTYQWVATYTVEPGYHWIEISTSWRDGPLPSDCSDMIATYMERYSSTATATLTVEIDQEACNAAKRGLTKARARVKARRASLRNAETGAPKRRARARLENAKRIRDRASQRVERVC